jgi:hypothetical protein
VKSVGAGKHCAWNSGILDKVDAFPVTHTVVCVCNLRRSMRTQMFLALRTAPELQQSAASIGLRPLEPMASQWRAAPVSKA